MGKDTKGILVPIDFTEAARHAVINAIALGKMLSADVHLVNFIPPLQNKRQQSTTTSEIEAISDNLTSSINLLKENEHRLAEILKDVDSTGVVIHSEIKMDKPSIGLKKQLKKKKIDLIVLGVNGAKTLGDCFFRSDQPQDLINVNCPVMVCNNHQHKFMEHQKVVVSLDFNALDEQNITNMIDIAQRLSIKIHCLYVNHPDDKSKWTKNRIAAYLRKHNLSADAIEVLNSKEKEHAIRQYAMDEKADFIAVSRFSNNGSHKKSYTEQVVEETENPVFVY